jgi:flagellar FliL protein
MPLVMGFAALTTLGISSGALFGMFLGNRLGPASAPKEQAAVGSSAKHAAAEAGNLKSLPPIITNLAGSERSWIRLEASLLMDGDASEDFNALAAKVGEDFMAYLRTVRPSQLEGAIGFQYLREDLRDRARLRSSKVRDLIVLTFVVE